MRPLIALALLLAAGALSAPFAARADELGAVVNRYLAWRGGASFERLASVHEIGALDTAGLTGTEEVWADSQGRVRIVDDTGVLKQVQVVADGRSWDIAPSGQVETLSIADHRSVGRFQALQFASALNCRAGASTQLMPSEARDGRRWAVVRISFGDADTYDAFIDPDTGTLAGFRIVEDRQGRFEGFGDWRMVDGVRMAFLHSTKTDAPGGDATVKLSTVELNWPIAAALLDRPAQLRKAAFANGASSTGWIDFDLFAGNRIYFPAKVNGHEVIVLLDSGASVSSIDKAFAASIGLASRGGFSGAGSGGIDTVGFIPGVRIEVGDLTLNNINVGAFDFAPIAKAIDHPLPFVLGDELFNELAVDIDFEHHRIAFRDPATAIRPANAIEVPLIRVKDRAVPVSIEGAPAVPFEFDLGNGSPLGVFPAYYKAHRLLQGRRTSQELAGGVGGFQPQPVATLRRVGFAGIEFSDVPADFSPDILSGANSNLVVGNLGLPILARFRLVIDYAHDRLFAAPYPDAAKTAFDKDRLGLFLDRKGAEVLVIFVAPGSPGEAAGFKAGDRIAQIDHNPAAVFPDRALHALRAGPAGRAVIFTLVDGAERRVVLADFY